MKMLLVAIFVATAAGILVLTAGRRPPIPSPSGNLLLRPTVRNGRVIIRIYDKSGSLVFREKSEASAFHRWSVAWASENRVVLDSSDCGIREWTRDESGKWAFYDDGQFNMAKNQSEKIAGMRGYLGASRCW